MILINLLPEELRKIERVRKTRINITLVAAGVAAVAVAILLVVFFMIGRRVSHLAEARAKLARLVAPREEAERILQRKHVLSKEIEMLDGYSSGRMSCHRRLNEVSDAFPEDLFLVSLGWGATPPGALLIRGEALPGYSIQRVVEFIDALRKIPAFMEHFPEIDYSIESIEAGRKAFEIRCMPAKKDGA